MKTGINIKEVDNYWIYGPIKFNCKIKNAEDSDVKYAVTAEGPSGANKALTICNSDGTTKELSGTGDKSFYIKIKKSDLPGGLAKINLNATVQNATRTKSKTQKGYLYYEYDGDHQFIKTIAKHKIYESETETEINVDDDLTWKAINVWIEAKKVDKDNQSIELQNVEFYVKRGSTPDDASGRYLKLPSGVTAGDSNGKGYDDKREWVVKENATKFKTTSGGNLVIKNLKGGLRYRLEEASNNNYGYLASEFEEYFITEHYNEDNLRGRIFNITLKNEKQTGNLVIDKKDKHSANPLEGISFRIKDSSGKYIKVKSGDNWKTTSTGKVHVDDMKTSSNASDATEFITDSNGKIEINNILIGLYDIEETSVGNNLGYVVEDDKVSWSFKSTGNESSSDGTSSGTGTVARVRVYRRDSRNTKATPATDGRDDIVTFYNEKAYIKISGYAWEEAGIGKQSGSTARNNLYNSSDKDPVTGKADQRLANIPVTLYKADGSKIDNTVTDANGQYKFGNTDEDTSKKPVKIDDLPGAYIEFKYNGMSYEATDVVEANLLNNSSSVAEGTERTSFNNRFEKIDGVEENKGKSGSLDLEYVYHEDEGQNDDNSNTAKHYRAYTSTVKYGDSVKRGYAGQEFPVSGVYEQYEVKASTKNVSKLGDFKTLAENALNEGKDEISSINIGLYQREQPDLSATSDISNVEININNYSHIYNYGNQIAKYNPEHKNEYDIYDPTVKKGAEYRGISYERQLYKSDYYYTGENPLDVYVTYEIRLANEADTLQTTLNSLVDYYDKNYYEFVSLGIDKNNDGTYAKTINSGESGITDDKSRTDDYGKISISGVNLEITARSEKSVYIKFKLINYKGLLNNPTFVIKPNYAEINSYSTKDSSNNIYGGIDEDSNPGNISLNKAGTNYNEDYFEDDNTWAPTVKFEVSLERKLTGVIFEDEPKEGTSGGPGNERLGDGKLTDIDKKRLQGATVNLVDLSGNVVRTVKSDSTEEINIEDITNEKGEFTLSNFMPGEYKVVYTWGDGNRIRSIQNIDYQEEIKLKDYKGTIWTTDNKNEKDTSGSGWYNINVNTRYSDARDENWQRKVGEEIEKATEMKSLTNTANFGIEKGDNISSKTGSTEKSDLSDFIINGPEYVINNVDFGIIERPRQELELNKRIKEFKVILANGQTIIDAKIEPKKDIFGNIIYDENGNIIYNLVDEAKYVTYMSPSNSIQPRNGMVRAEIDNELIQGAKAYIIYEIRVDNISEKDYYNEGYYLYGSDSYMLTTDLIKIKPTKVYDYLDDSMNKTEESSDWEVQDISNIAIYPLTFLENYIYNEYESTHISPEETLTEKIGFEMFSKTASQYGNSWTEESIRQRKVAGKTVFSYEGSVKFEEELLPGEYRAADLSVSKVLSNLDEIELNNDSEIVDIEHSSNQGGRIVKVLDEMYDRGETIIITPPTGETGINITQIIAIAISSLIIIGTGIVFIKKKILK